MNRPDRIWQDDKIASGFLHLRTAFPYAMDHPRIMRDILRTGRPIGRFLDVGCGGGFFANALHAEWPDAEAVMVDFSEPMLAEAERNVTGPKQLLVRDLADPAWAEGLGEFDAVVSGFAIHHLPDDTKRSIYRDIFAALRPGGWFLHAEHVASRSSVGKALFDRDVDKALYQFAARQQPGITPEQAAAQYHDDCDEQANILAPVEDQCGWLREIGFVDVDCFFKWYEIAIFGGRVAGDERGGR